MTTEYVQISIPLEKDIASDIFIAALIEIGFDGFQEEEDYLLAFIEESKLNTDELNAFANNHGIAYTKTKITQKNWNEEWEKNFHPVIIENFCAIRASFHKPISTAKHEIVITPKMSFGTGHHATTELMIQAISQIDCSEKDVLDFGTGTGILAILAEKCGAKKVIAIDNDEWSIENAKENLIENNCKKILLEQNNSINHAETFDIILANINKNTIIKNIISFEQHAKAGGVIILSGLLNEDYREIEAEVQALKILIVNKINRNNWICIKLKKRL